MRVLLSYFFLQNLEHYQCCYWFCSNVQRFSESTGFKEQRYKRTCTQCHKSQCLWCWERGLMVLPLEEVIFLYRHCQTWLLSCLRNHSKAQTGLPERASHDICRISPGQSTARVYLAGLFEEPTIHWLLSAVETEVLCQCLTFLTISIMTVCALCLAEESTFWRFSLNGDSLRAGHWIQLSRHVISLLFVATFEHLPLIIYLFLVQLENVQASPLWNYNFFLI